MAGLWRCHKELPWKQKGTKLRDSCVQDALRVSWFRMQNEHQSPFFVQPPEQIPRKPCSRQWRTGGAIPPGPHDSRRTLPRSMGPTYDGRWWPSNVTVLKKSTNAKVTNANLCPCSACNNCISYLAINSFKLTAIILHFCVYVVCKNALVYIFSYHLMHIHL